MDTTTRRRFLKGAPATLAAVTAAPFFQRPAVAQVTVEHREAIHAAAVVVSRFAVAAWNAPKAPPHSAVVANCETAAALLKPVTDHLAALGAAYRAELDRLADPEEREAACYCVGTYLAEAFLNLLRRDLAGFGEDGQAFITTMLNSREVAG